MPEDCEGTPESAVQALRALHEVAMRCGEGELDALLESELAIRMRRLTLAYAREACEGRDALEIEAELEQVSDGLGESACVVAQLVQRHGNAIRWRGRSLETEC